MLFVLTGNDAFELITRRHIFPSRIGQRLDGKRKDELSDSIYEEKGGRQGPAL